MEKIIWIRSKYVNIAEHQILWHRSSYIIENLTITCKNMRYPIHNNGYSIETEQRIINCHIECIGNWNSDGTGIASFEECDWTSCHAHERGTSKWSKNV